MSVAGPNGIDKAHPTVAYRIRCSGSCSGETSYQARVLPQHGRPRSAPKLDFGPAQVSIGNEWGGAQRFAHHYGGSALRMLEKLLRAGGILEVRISVRVASASGLIARAQSTVRFY